MAKLDLASVFDSLPDWVTGRDVRPYQGPPYLPPAGQGGSYRKEVANDLARQLSDDPWTQKNITSATQAAADFIPGVAQDVGVHETAEQAAQGNYGRAALTGLGTAASVVPFFGGPLKRGLGNLADAVSDMPAISRLTGGRVAGPKPGLPLPGSPRHIEGPVPHVVQAAEDYARNAGIDLSRQTHYGTADPRRGEYIAEAYERMPHAPEDPKVNAAYQAMADETMAQWKALQDSGTQIEFIQPGMADPYPGGPKEALADLRHNNHLWVFPTESGFGPAGSALDTSSSPLLQSTGIVHGGHPMLINDAFRAVHDYFGHGMEGANFGARGEENAWRAHSRLYSPEALPAVTSETRGQNSWVNFGPFGEANRANQRGTVFAEQKTGTMPAWTQREGGMPLKYRAQQAGTAAALASALALARSSQQGHR